MVRVTPASSRSREARPGLSPGVRSPGQVPPRSAGKRARPEKQMGADLRPCLQWRAAVSRGTAMAGMRLSALRLPFSCVIFLARGGWHDSDAKAPRERAVLAEARGHGRS